MISWLSSTTAPSFAHFHCALSSISANLFYLRLDSSKNRFTTGCCMYVSCMTIKLPPPSFMLQVEPCLIVQLLSRALIDFTVKSDLC